MSAPNPAYPFGLHSIVVTNISGASQVSLPTANRMMVKERLQTGEAEGDDKLAAIASTVLAAEWELETKGISLEAWAIMTGRTLTTTGSSPNEIKSMVQDGSERMPYFKIYGKSLGEGDDDVHVLLFKCKITDGIEFTNQFGEFAGPTVKGIAVDDNTNGISKVVINETATSMPGS